MRRQSRGYEEAIQGFGEVVQRGWADCSEVMWRLSRGFGEVVQRGWGDCLEVMRRLFRGYE